MDDAIKSGSIRSNALYLIKPVDRFVGMTSADPVLPCGSLLRVAPNTFGMIVAETMAMDNIRTKRNTAQGIHFGPLPLKAILDIAIHTRYPT